jgi:hypothetical protein
VEVSSFQLRGILTARATARKAASMSALGSKPSENLIICREAVESGFIAFEERAFDFGMRDGGRVHARAQRPH